MNDLEKKASLALSNVLIEMPHLAGLAAGVSLQLDERVETAGVFASGRMLFNPGWLEKLPLPDATFVMAHELMHLMLMTHDRTEGSDPQLVNVAHDLIINRMLEKELGMRTPANGLNYKTVLQRPSWYRFDRNEGASLEEVVALLQKDGLSDKINQTPCWAPSIGEPGEPLQDTGLGEALRQALGQQPSGIGVKSPGQLTDVFTPADEQRMFPGETPASLEHKASELRHLAIEAISKLEIHEAVERAMEESFRRMGHGTGNSSYIIGLLRKHYHTPWDWALQQWMEATAPARNSYARPSRRGQHQDYVRPGKERMGYTLHIVLDTSGSMSGELSMVLGAIASFCETTGVETVHVLQCDTDVTADEWLPTGDLEKFQAHGFGGSDMSPGMNRLAEDPEVERAIVITDGCIEYPQEAMPYEVLWVLTERNEYFKPGYGRVVGVEG